MKMKKVIGLIGVVGAILIGCSQEGNSRATIILRFGLTNIYQCLCS